MLCPECGHIITDNRERCLYCGSRPERRTSVAPVVDQPEGPVEYGEGQGEDPKRTAAKENRYVNLNDLPEALRKKVIKALGQMDGRDAGEERGSNFFGPEFPESLSAEGDDGPDSRSGYVLPEEYFDLQLSRLRGKRRAPLNRFLLALLFFGAMALMGLAVWIMG